MLDAILLRPPYTFQIEILSLYFSYATFKKYAANL
jgi:hypothetical protein